jgi:hypothetical protein
MDEEFLRSIKIFSVEPQDIYQDLSHDLQFTLCSQISVITDTLINLLVNSSASYTTAVQNKQSVHYFETFHASRNYSHVHSPS